jgi:hypothetical protein
MSIDTHAGVTPDRILELGLGFWASKALLTAVELGVFSELAKGPRDLASLKKNYGFHGRGAADFFDALVALKMLDRQDGQYRNAPIAEQFLDKAKPAYVGGILEMANTRLYPFWHNLADGLRSGQPQNEVKTGVKGEGLFDKLYADPAKLKEFLSAMTGLSLGAVRAMAQKFDWKRYKTFVDVGCAQGCLPVQISKAHAHLTGGGYDLPVVRPIFEEYVRANELSDRLKFHEGDMFKQALPGADVLVMGHILHDWDMEQKRELVHKAYTALPRGGAFIVYEAMIDDDRRENALGLLMSLNMLIETPGGFDYTAADCKKWMHEAGFRETRSEPLAGGDSMVVGIK